MRHFGRFQSLLCMDNSPLSLHYFTLSQLLEAENTIENLSMQDHTLLEEASKQLQRTSGSFWMHPSICDASMTCCWGLVWYPEKGLTTQKNENIRTEKKKTHRHTHNDDERTPPHHLRSESILQIFARVRWWRAN